jgi:quercetin dioxygenase-like cupin family protein
MGKATVKSLDSRDEIRPADRGELEVVELEGAMGVTRSLPETTGGYALGPDDGEALWFNGALGLLRATAEQTNGRYAAFELRPTKGFAAPLHVHNNEDEFFLVLSGTVRLQHGDDVVEGVPGSFVYTPRGVGHSFHVDSDEARLLLFFGPAAQLAACGRARPRPGNDRRAHEASRPDDPRPTAPAEGLVPSRTGHGEHHSRGLD